MISDVLADARAAIRQYQHQMHDTYREMAPALKKLLQLMQAVQTALDMPPINDAVQEEVNALIDSVAAVDLTAVAAARRQLHATAILQRRRTP